MRTAIILVGGQAKRAECRKKYFFLHEGKTFLSRLLDSLVPVVDEIILVARDPEQCKRFGEYPDIICVTDQRQVLVQLAEFMLVFLPRQEKTYSYPAAICLLSAGK